VLDAEQRIVMVNQALADWLGFQRDSLIGTPVSLLCELPQDVNGVAAEPIAAGAPPMLCPLSLRHRDGRLLSLQAEIRRLPPPITTASLMLLLRPSAPAPASGASQA